MSRAGRGPPTSSGVTRNGPTGVVESQFLPCSHSRVRNCQSRQVMSFSTVNPAIAAIAVGLVGSPYLHVRSRRRARPPSRTLGLGRPEDVVVRTDQRVGELAEQGRVLGQVAAHLLDVVAVVQPDAHDLARPRDQRREVGAGQRVLLAVGNSQLRRVRRRRPVRRDRPARRPRPARAVVRSSTRIVASFTGRPPRGTG